MVSLISSNQNTNLPIELPGNMTKEIMKTSDVRFMFSIGILYPITTWKNTDNLTEVLSNNAELFISNKKVTINPHQPPWITCKKIDRGKDFIVKQDSQARSNIGQDFGHLEMK